jgi:phage gp29-like protein
MAKRKRPSPKRHERIRTGRSIPQDPASGIDAPPNLGRQPMPHTLTFSSLIGTMSKAYKNPDEAVLHSLENARWMRNTCLIMECLEARQRGTALLNWHLEPEDKHDKAQVGLCERLTKIVQEIPDFTEYRRNLLEALWYGRYAIQHGYGFDWRTGKKRVLIKSWRPIHGDKLVFRYDDGTGKFDPNQIGIRVGTQYNKNDALAGDRKLETTDQGLGYFLEPWERSLIAVHRHMIEDAPFESALHAGAIHGIGIRSRIYWTWFQMQNVLQMLMDFLQRSAQGIWIYFYPAGNAQAKADMEKAAKEQTDTNILVMPRMPGDPGMDAYGVDRVEVSPAGGEALMNVLNNYFGHSIKRYILGQTLTTEADATGLGSGVADLHLESFLQIVRYDSSKLEETITRETIEPLKNYNEPEFRNVLVRFKIDTEASDTDKKLEAVERVWNMGAKIKTEDVMGLIGFSIPTSGDDALFNPQLVQSEPAGIAGQPGAPGAVPEQPSTPQEIAAHIQAELGQPQSPEPIAEAAGDGGAPEPSSNHHIVTAIGGARIERGDELAENVQKALDAKGMVSRLAKPGRARQYRAAKSRGLRWITLESGTHILLDGKGNVHAGPESLVGKPLGSKDKPVERERQKPSERLTQAIGQAAGEHEIDQGDLREAVDYLHAERKRDFEEREVAKAGARRLTGLTAGDISRLENAGLDYTSGRKAGGATGEKLRYFDEYAQEAAREYPELGLGDPDDKNEDFAANLWGVLSEGKRDMPAKHDPKLIAEAARLVKDAGAYAHAGDDAVPFQKRMKGGPHAA